MIGFCEMLGATTGDSKRKSDIKIEGRTIDDDLDIYQKVGACKAYESYGEFTLWGTIV